MRLLILADPASPRVASMLAAFAARGHRDVILVPFSSWLLDPGVLLDQLDDACWLKIEASGEDAASHQALIALGAYSLELPVPAPLEHGEIAHLNLWFAGFSKALLSLEQELEARPWVRCFNRPAAILDVCDKLRCQELLTSRGISIPPLLGAFSGFAALESLLKERNSQRVFIKPRYGSSASGVLALETDGKGRYQAFTSVEYNPGNSRIFNSLKMRRYTGGAVAGLVDSLSGESLYAERWIPKPRKGSRSFDWRVVTIGQQVQHRVARLSRGPLTNLHLGNARGDAEDYLDQDGAVCLETTARHVAECFPGNRILGIDMIVSKVRAHVLEVNAFGDWLPRLLWMQRTVHEAEADWLLDQTGKEAA